MVSQKYKIIEIIFDLVFITVGPFNSDTLTFLEKLSTYSLQ